MTAENDEKLYRALKTDQNFNQFFQAYLNDGYGSTPGIKKEHGVTARRLNLELCKSEYDVKEIKAITQELINQLSEYLPANDKNLRSSHYTIYPLMVIGDLERVVKNSGVEDITFPPFTGKDLPLPDSKEHDIRMDGSSQSGTPDKKNGKQI